MTDSKSGMVFWLGDARGIYLPRDFAKSFMDRDKNVQGVKSETWEILERGPGPGDDDYWEAWDEVLLSAVVISNTDATRYRLYQDGDLWLVPEGMEWSDKEDTFVWPQENGE